MNKIPDKALRIMQLLSSPFMAPSGRMVGPARDVLIVGGFVRDAILGIASKDVDIEVYGLDIDIIRHALESHGFQVDAVGKAFGVLKIDNEIDVSIPRRENKIGVGHRDFEILPDFNMSVEDAAARRDFTINSMAMRMDGTIIDPFNGQKDIQLPVLRATSAAFQEDALRVLRAMQFAARFSGVIADRPTLDMAIAMRNEFQFLPKERIWEEWKKFALKGKSAFFGFLVLSETGWLDLFPELNAMVGVAQDPEWHPEGEVFTHTVLVVQKAINLADANQLDDNDRMVLFFAALCHDMGKPATTRMEGGRWRAKGHCEDGVAVAETFLASIGAPLWLIEQVRPLVREHLVHAAGTPTDRAVRRLAQRLAPSNIRMLSMLIESDHSGRSPLPKGNPFTAWMDVASRLNLGSSKPIPILRGRDLIGLGVSPGPTMGDILKRAFDAQLDGSFTDLQGALHWAALNVAAHNWAKDM
jgi:tRNA nucleotidyltransferase (CCA-adding enzyme)